MIYFIYIAIVGITMVVSEQRNENYVICVRDGYYVFGVKEQESQELIRQLDIPVHEFKTFKRKCNRNNPMDILSQFSDIYGEHQTFIVHFEEEYDNSLTTRTDNSMDPKVYVIFVCDGYYQFATTISESAELIKKEGIPIEKVQIFHETFYSQDPMDILKKFSEIRCEHQTFMINFMEQYNEEEPTRQKDLLIPDYIVYQITDILDKTNTVIIFVSNNEVKFATTPDDCDEKLIELRYSKKDLPEIKATYQSSNSYSILMKLTQINHKSDTFLVTFTEEPGSQFPGIEELVEKIKYIVVNKNSKTCVIYVLDGKVIFVTTEPDCTGKIKEHHISNEIVKQAKNLTYESQNVYDILGKTLQIRSAVKTFMVYFTEGASLRFPPIESIMTIINDILLVKKSKTCAFYIVNRQINFATTEEDARKRIKKLKLTIKILTDSFEPLNLYIIYGKLINYITKNNFNFLVIFTEESGPQQTEIRNLGEILNKLIVLQKSKTCVVYVSNHKIRFIERDVYSAKNNKKVKVPSNINAFKETFAPGNICDIIGRLLNYNKKYDSFLIVFTECSRGYEHPRFQVPGYRLINKGFRFLDVLFPSTSYRGLQEFTRNVVGNIIQNVVGSVGRFRGGIRFG